LLNVNEQPGGYWTGSAVVVPTPRPLNVSAPTAEHRSAVPGSPIEVSTGVRPKSAGGFVGVPLVDGSRLVPDPVEDEPELVLDGGRPACPIPFVVDVHAVASRPTAARTRTLAAANRRSRIPSS